MAGCMICHLPVIILPECKLDAAFLHLAGYECDGEHQRVAHPVVAHAEDVRVFVPHRKHTGGACAEHGFRLAVQCLAYRRHIGAGL